MCASSGWETIGASTPSTSSSTADREGSSRRGLSSSSSVAVGSGTRLVWRRMGRTLQLGAIGTMAGLFGGVFGVGGGIVIVPLLVLWLGYEEREATGTSLAAIVLIGIVAATLQGVYGNLRYGYGLADRDPRRGRRRRGDVAAAAHPDALDHSRLLAAARRDRDRAAGVIEVLGILALGFAAGVTAGLFGVGG